MDEQAVDEFIQKFEAEINQHSASIQATNKSKQQMVRTSINKGSRNVYLVTTYLSASSSVVAELSRFLRLAQGVVLNHLILKEEKTAAAA